MQAACQRAYPFFFSTVVSVASEALSASGTPWQEGARYSLSVCPLFLPPVLLIQAGDILTHQEGRCHLSEASCALLHVVQPRVFLERWCGTQLLRLWSPSPKCTWSKLSHRPGPWCSQGAERIGKHSSLPPAASPDRKSVV